MKRIPETIKPGKHVCQCHPISRVESITGPAQDLWHPINPIKETLRHLVVDARESSETRYLADVRLNDRLGIYSNGRDLPKR